MARSPLPTLAAVNGPAVGAGMNLALACDVRLAGASARFDTRFLQLGIHPGGGHTWMLERAVGPSAAAAMVLFGQVVDGARAEQIGLAWRCVPDHDLLDEAMTMAGRAAAAPRELVRRTKETLADMAAIGDHDAAVERELTVQLWSMDTPEFKADAWPRCRPRSPTADPVPGQTFVGGQRCAQLEVSRLDHQVDRTQVTTGPAPSSVSRWPPSSASCR